MKYQAASGAARRSTLAAMLGSILAIALAVYWGLLRQAPILPAWSRWAYAIAFIAIAANGVVGARMAAGTSRHRLAIRHYLFSGLFAVIIPLGLLVTPFFVAAVLFLRRARASP